MALTKRFSELSPARQALIRLFQTLNFGQVLRVVIRNGDPVFHPEPTVLIDLRLDALEGERQEAESADFALCEEVQRLIRYLDEVQDGTIERIEVRAGIPRRAVFESRVSGRRP